MLGFALAAGNFDGDSRRGRPLDDLAIGVPGENVARDGATVADAGAVVVARGTANGLDGAGWADRFTRSGGGRFHRCSSPATWRCCRTWSWS